MSMKQQAEINKLNSTVKILEERVEVLENRLDFFLKSDEESNPQNKKKAANG